MGTPALRIIALSFIPAGFCCVCTAVFQALGKGMHGMIVSLLRQTVLVLPAAWLLARTGELFMVWWAVPIAEVLSFVPCLIMVVKLIQGIELPGKACGQAAEELQKTHETCPENA